MTFIKERKIICCGPNKDKPKNPIELTLRIESIFESYVIAPRCKDYVSLPNEFRHCNRERRKDDCIYVCSSLNLKSEFFPDVDLSNLKPFQFKKISQK